MYNIIYLGSSAKACDYINCHDNFNVAAVVCEKKMVNEELLTCCFLRDVPLTEIETHDDLLNTLNENKSKFDFGIMYIFGMILRQSLLQDHRVYNIHMGYLPFYKGRHSTFFATINGEKSIGISLHEVIPKIDEGRIIARRKVPYYFWMGESELREKMIGEIPALLDELSIFLSDPAFQCIKNRAGDYYTPIKDEMINIDEKTPVNLTMNIIRSQQAYRGARFVNQHLSFFVRSAQVKCWEKTDESYYKEDTEMVTSSGEIVGVSINEKYFLLFTEVVR